MKVPPFPQNKLLELRYLKGTAADRRRHYHRTDYFYAMLIPVLNQPSDSNQYYVINSRGKTKGYSFYSFFISILPLPNPKFGSTFHLFLLFYASQISNFLFHHWVHIYILNYYKWKNISNLPSMIQSLSHLLLKF